MNREILHRGKDIHSGEWLIGSYVKRLSKGELKHYIIPIDFDGCWSEREVIEETVGQYWRTVSDQKLFDGDVFSITRDGKLRVTYVVEFRALYGTFCVLIASNYKDPETGHYWHIPVPEWWTDHGRKIAIIGNVHDQPELLTK